MWSSLLLTNSSNPLLTISSTDIRSVTMFWYPGNLPGNVKINSLLTTRRLLTLPNQADDIFEVLLVVAARAKDFDFLEEELVERDRHLWVARSGLMVYCTRALKNLL